jgi:hypothetical protein
MSNPSVSLITITQYSRFDCLQILVDLISDQTYKNIIEWVIVEGSKTQDEIDKSSLQIKNLISYLTSKKTLNMSIKYISNTTYNIPLGKLRNIGNNACQGDITVCMDDDDYYPVNRVAHAVKQLIKSNALIVGCSRLIIYDYNLDKLYQSSEHSKFHSTNACMAWKKAYLKTNSHDETKTFAEERSFTKDYTEKLIQLDPLKTIIASSHNLNTYNKKKIFVSTYINNINNVDNIMLKELNTSIDKLINNKYLNRYKNIFINKISNIHDIVIFCGGFHKQLDPLNYHLDNDDVRLIELAENWVKSGKTVAIYAEVNKLTLNGVDYDDWTQFPYDQTFKTLIIRKYHGLICYAPFKIKSDQVWLDVIDNNIYIYKNILDKFNCKFDKIIFKSNYHMECFKNIINQNLINSNHPISIIPKSNHQISIIPNGLRIDDFKITKSNVSRNFYRFCYCSHYTNGLKELLENIWTPIYNYEPRTELHIYNIFDTFTTEEAKLSFEPLFSKSGIMYHGSQPLDIIIREKYMSSFELLIPSNTNMTDCVNLKESAIAGCIPIVSNIEIFNELDVYHIQITNMAIKLIPIYIIQLLKNQEKIIKSKEEYINSNSNFNWDLISKKWFEFDI